LRRINPVARSENPAYALSSLYLYLTGGCNLHCAHCWLDPEFLPREEKMIDGLTAHDVKKAIGEAKPLGLSNIKLTGGEPFLSSDIFKILEIITEEELSVTIETNGTLIDRETAAFLKSRGISEISVSIDSPRASFHDTFRGVRGALDQAVAGAEQAVAQGINVQFIMSLVSENAQDIEPLMAMAKELGAASVKVNPVMPIGRGNTLTRKGRTVPVEELISLARWSEGELAEKYGINVWFTIPSAFKPVDVFVRGKNAECHILNILGIVSTGHVSMCGIGREVDGLVMGNIRKDSLRDIWCSSPILAALRDLVPQKMEGVCGRCILKGICLGSCRADAFVLSGSLATPFWICQEAYEKGLFPEQRII
jgi:SynChlorMet cassette radical SAM/SPASM protein ScmF